MVSSRQNLTSAYNFLFERHLEQLASKLKEDEDQLKDQLEVQLEGPTQAAENECQEKQVDLIGEQLVKRSLEDVVEELLERLSTGDSDKMLKKLKHVKFREESLPTEDGQ